MRFIFHSQINSDNIMAIISLGKQVDVTTIRTERINRIRIQTEDAYIPFKERPESTSPCALFCN